MAIGDLRLLELVDDLLEILSSLQLTGKAVGYDGDRISKLIQELQELRYELHQKKMMLDY